MGPQSARAVALDAGALVAFERNDRRVRRLVELAVENGLRLYVAAGVVGQVWRDGVRQARISRLLGSEAVVVQALDVDEAKAAGVMCGIAGTADVIDSSVALLARRYGASVVTSDPDDLRRLDSSLELVRC